MDPHVAPMAPQVAPMASQVAPVAPEVAAMVSQVAPMAPQVAPMAPQVSSLFPLDCTFISAWPLNYFRLTTHSFHLNLPEIMHSPDSPNAICPLWHLSSLPSHPLTLPSTHTAVFPHYLSKVLGCTLVEPPGVRPGLSVLSSVPLPSKCWLLDLMAHS